MLTSLSFLVASRSWLTFRDHGVFLFFTKWRMVGSNHLPEATDLQSARASNALNTLRVLSCYLYSVLFNLSTTFLVCPDLVPPCGIEPLIHRPGVYSALDVPASCPSGYRVSVPLPYSLPLSLSNSFLIFSAGPRNDLRPPGYPGWPHL